jgi:RecA/RadA recombinase
MTPDQLAAWGIDLDRYQAYDTNNPVEIFDTIETMVPQLIEQGMNLRLIGIDSITNIQGIQSMSADSVEDQLRADSARTIQNGLSRILPMLRKYKVSIMITAQVRAEQDPNKAKYTPTKMAGGFYLQHAAEYFIDISKDGRAESKKDMEGNELAGSLKDSYDEVDATGHKIRIRMMGNSCGPAGRSGVVTVDYSKGFINQHEEVFMLAVNRRIFSRPNNRTYTYKDKRWTSKDEALQAVKASVELQQEIIKELRRQDIEKDYSSIPSTALTLEDLDKAD